jgi:hypothetical protein
VRHSTGKQTAEEAARIKFIMSLSCAVCALHGDVSKRPLECHHIVRGGKRLGHWYTLQLCIGHHRGLWLKTETLLPRYRVAISDGRQAFRRAHGGYDDLQIWQRQQVVLGYDDALPATKIVPRREALTEATCLTTAENT